MELVKLIGDGSHCFVSMLCFVCLRCHSVGGLHPSGIDFALPYTKSPHFIESKCNSSVRSVRIIDLNMENQISQCF